MSIKHVVAGAASALTLTAGGLAFLSGWEGGSPTKAYADPILGWKVPTICMGATGPNIKRDTVFTRAMCDDLDSKNVQYTLNTLSKCVTRRPLDPGKVTALVSISHNIGADKICKSTLVRKLNAGDMLGAANEFPKWGNVTVNGKLVPSKGLQNRRQAERKVFLGG